MSGSTREAAQILVVDDDPAVLVATARILEGAGYAVRQADGVAQARQALAEAAPDLLLLDVVLGQDSGIELCREVKASPAWAAVFVVLISGARTSTDDQAEGLESLADGYVARPISNRELLARVEAYLRIRRAHQELVRAEGYRSLADLSLGVSHNLNNLLTAIIVPAEVLRRSTSDERLLQQIERIDAAAHRARVLVQRVERSVSNLARALVQPVDVEAEVRQAVSESGLRWSLASANPAVSVALELAQVPRVRAVAAELRDALEHLLQNAVEAMPGGGTVTVTAAPEGEGVRLSVTDTGVGMDEETRRRALDPLFSTKHTVGVGLGLSLVHGSVRRWGGTVELESQPGTGTSVHLRLRRWVEGGA